MIFYAMIVFMYMYAILHDYPFDNKVKFKNNIFCFWVDIKAHSNQHIHLQNRTEMLLYVDIYYSKFKVLKR